MLALVLSAALASSVSLEISGNMRDEAAGTPPAAPVPEITVPAPSDGGADSNVPVTVTPATDTTPVTVTPVVQ